jgi:ComF family protein
VSTAAESLFATLFPSDCRLCGAPLVKISRLPVCEECLLHIRPLDGSVCAICGERLGNYRLVNDHNQPCCPACYRDEPAFAKAAAYGSYAGGLRDLIHLLKYDNVRPAANVLGRMLAEVIDALAGSFGDTQPVVVPVPLHASKFRQRGFNQSELVARIALKLNPRGLVLHSNALERCRATTSQIGLTRQQRQRNIRGAFIVAHPAEIRGRDVLLVDDVLTTGTTASECARVLRRGGANRVFVATVARTLRNEVARVEIPREPESEESARLSRAAHV